jgi:hypothetical protein
MIALALALAAAQPAQKPAVTGGLDPMYKLGIGLDEAWGAFARLCLVKPFDPMAFETAVRSSSWRYRRNAGTGPDLVGYDSRKGYVSIKWLGPPQGRLPQCNLDAATARAIPRETIAVRIEARIARLRGSAPPRREVEGALFWEWPGEADKVVRLYWLRHPNTDPRQITLTLQKWPAEAIRP